MQCPNGCPSPMEERKEEKIFHRNGEPIVISDLIMYVCPDCGQESMPLSSARIVEDILNGRVKPSGKFTAKLYEVSLVR
ncbi:MAG: YgiT-type zinc finger protein [Candidatus Bipolaricaulota bacterium]|nr:YgiT-type zinc finger protein [Candidatus Bipolaricaulota bacterium]